MSTVIPTFEMYNGNNQLYSRPLPMIIIQANPFNEVARKHIEKQTGLAFEEKPWHQWEAQPTSYDQYMRLFLTYNFKTRYYNNWQYNNTLVLRFDHHHGFDVTSICYDCIQHNHIRVNDLRPGDRLKC